jgi:hypothetical protein
VAALMNALAAVMALAVLRPLRAAHHTKLVHQMSSPSAQRT